MDVSERLLERRNASPATSSPNLDGEIVALMNGHPEWNKRIEGDGPVYALPMSVFNDQSSLRHLFNEMAYTAEKSFASVCHRQGFIGYMNQAGISYPPLQSVVIPPDILKAFLRSRKIDKPNQGEVQVIGNEVQGRWERLLAYAGFLQTDPGYLADVEQFRSTFEPTLDVYERTWRRFPGLYLSERNIQARRTLSPGGFVATHEYDLNLANWLDRWGLSGFATWDWPVPVGPTATTLANPTNNLLPKHGVYVYIPPGYPLAGDVKLILDVYRQQRNAAQHAGLPPAIAGLPHHITYAQMARVIHIQRTLGSRFPEQKPRYVEHMVSVAADFCGVNVDRIQKLRGMISACQDGNRSSVKELETK